MKRAATFAFLLAAVAQSASADPKLGNWEYTTSVQVPGMPAQMPQLPPGVQLPPGLKMDGGGLTHTFQHCVTKDDLVPKNEKDCTITKQEHKGDTITWAATCNTPQGKADAEGTATYSDDAMKGSMHMKGMTAKGIPFEMTQQMSGKYLGECAAGAK
jgi:hypothetical protein